MVTRKHPSSRIDAFLSSGATTNAIGDYSSSATEFSITPPSAGLAYALYRMVVLIEDAGNIDADGYGAMSALTNGISIQVLDTGDVEYADVTAGETIKRNADWAGLCYDADVKTWGVGNSFLAVRWTFSKDANSPIMLPYGHRLVATLNDNFSGLVTQRFAVKGHSVS